VYASRTPHYRSGVFSRIQFPDAIFFSVGPGESRRALSRGVGPWVANGREREREIQPQEGAWKGAEGGTGGGEGEGGGRRGGAAHIRALWHVPSRSQLN